METRKNKKNTKKNVFVLTYYDLARIPPQTPLKLTEALKGAEQVDTGGASTVGGARVAHTCPNQVRAFQTAAPPLLSAVLHHAALLLRRAKKKARLTRSHRSPKHAHL